MTTKKFITLGQLANYTGKIKENLNKKLDNSGNQTLSGSLTTTGNVMVQGDLEVKGITRTVNQETLTVKDNLITINGGGIPLTTAGMAGIVAVTGANQYVLNGNYMIDGQALFDMADITTIYTEDVTWQDYFGPYKTVVNNPDIITRFNSLNLWPANIIVLNDPYGNVSNVGEIRDALSLQIGSGYPGMNLMFNYLDTTGHLTPGTLIAIEMSFKKDGTFDNFTVGPTAVVKFENQIISGEDIDFILKFIKTEDGSTLTSANLNTNGVELKGKAYAAPIYDVNSDTLKIGLGSYEKNENGDVISFEFGAGQGQSLTTRDDNIRNNSVVKWDSVSNKLKEAPISAHNNYVRVNGDLKADSLTIQDNLIALNSIGTTTSKVGVIMVDGLETDLLRQGTYTLDSKLLFEAMGYYQDDTGSGCFKNASTLLSALSALQPTYIHCDGDAFSRDFLVFTWDIDGSIDQTGVDESHFLNFTLSVHANGQVNTLISLRNNGLGEEPVIETINASLEFTSSNQEISSKHFDAYKQFIRYGTEDGELLTHAHLIGGTHTAYAAPIYDPQTNTLRIGQGTFSRDNNGNIKSFDFIAGESQAVATRADDLEDSCLVEWDGNQKKLVKAGSNPMNAVIIDKSLVMWGSNGLTRFTNEGIFSSDYYTNLIFPKTGYIAEETLATREWTNTQLDTKVSNFNGANYVYATNSNKELEPIKLSSQPNANTMMYRDENGRSKIADAGSNGTDIVNNNTILRGKGVDYIHRDSSQTSIISNGRLTCTDDDTNDVTQLDPLLKWGQVEPMGFSARVWKHGGKVQQTTVCINPDELPQYEVTSKQGYLYKHTPVDPYYPGIISLPHAMVGPYPVTATINYKVGSTTGQTTLQCGPWAGSEDSSHEIPGANTSINMHVLSPSRVSITAGGGNVTLEITAIEFDYEYNTYKEVEENYIYLPSKTGTIVLMDDLNDLASKQPLEYDPTGYLSARIAKFGSSRASGEYSFSYGVDTEATGARSAAFNHHSVASGERSFAVNFSEASGKHAFSANYGVATGEQSAAFGYATADSEYQFAVGNKTAANTNALFKVGNNKSTNAFEVLTDGRAKVQTKPEEDNDVVRLGDIKKLLPLIENLTSEEIAELVEFAKTFNVTGE